MGVPPPPGNYLRKAGNGERRHFLLLGHNFLSTDIMLIKMYFWVELYMKSLFQKTSYIHPDMLLICIIDFLLQLK